MIKIIFFLIFIGLFLYVITSPIGQSALAGLGGFFTGFYDNGLVYANAEIWSIFAIFMFIVGYAIIKH